MKRHQLYAPLIILILVLAGCEKTFIQDPIPIYPPYQPPYAGLEKQIREKYDYRAVFSWSQYIDLMNELSKDKYLVLPLNEMRSTYSDSRVVIGLRHDIDMNPFKALEMAEIEKDFGFSATYFFLPTADYYGYLFRTGLNRSIGLDSLLKDLFDRGTEIGIHNDMLTAMIDYGFAPFIFNSNEL